MVKRLLLITVIILLAGCAYHLRGINNVPSWLNNLAIVIENAHRDLGPTLKDQLESYKLKVNPDLAQADYILIIQSDGIQQQITNIAASTAPRQYLLIYTLQFKLIKTKGGEIISPTFVSVTRQLTVNNDRILGSNSEETQLMLEMRHNAAMQVINRLSRENKSLPINS